MHKSLRLLGKFCAILLLYTIPHTAQSAPLLYEFSVETLIFCTGGGGECGSPGLPVPGFTPHTAGFLFLEDSAVTRGSVSYSAINLNPPPSTVFPPQFSVVGNTDFLFRITDTFNEVIIPVILTIPSLIALNAYVNLVINPEMLSGGITFNSPSEQLHISIANNFATGFVATDDDTFGCSLSQCTFTCDPTTVGTSPLPGRIKIATQKSKG